MLSQRQKQSRAPAKNHTSEKAKLNQTQSKTNITNNQRQNKPHVKDHARPKPKATQRTKPSQAVNKIKPNHTGDEAKPGTKLNLGQSQARGKSQAGDTAKPRKKPSQTIGEAKPGTKPSQRQRQDEPSQANPDR